MISQRLQARPHKKSFDDVIITNLACRLSTAHANSLTRGQRAYSFFFFFFGDVIKLPNWASGRLAPACVEGLPRPRCTVRKLLRELLLQLRVQELRRFCVARERAVSEVHVVPILRARRSRRGADAWARSARGEHGGTGGSRGRGGRREGGRGVGGSGRFFLGWAGGDGGREGRGRGWRRHCGWVWRSKTIGKDKERGKDGRTENNESESRKWEK